MTVSAICSTPRLEIFAGLGIAVTPLEVPDPSLPFRLALIVLKAEAAAVHEDWIRNRPGDYDHGIREGMDTWPVPCPR